MSAKHDHDRAAIARRVHDGVDDRAEIARDQDIGQGVDEGGERFAAGRVGRWVGELAGADLVGAAGDRNGANGGQIRLARQWFLAGAVTRLSGVVAVGDGWYDLR
jgi:hypothetical protein